MKIYTKMKKNTETLSGGFNSETINKNHNPNNGEVNMSNLSIKWKNKLSRHGYNLQNIDYDRWIDDDGSRNEVFQNTETNDTVFLTDNILTVCKGGSKKKEFEIKVGLYFMNTVMNLLDKYEIINKNQNNN